MLSAVRKVITGFRADGALWPPPGHWRLNLALALAYYLAGKLGLSYAALHSSASAVWPPTGIALGAMLIAGYGVWPAVFVGAFLVNVTNAGSVFTSLGIATGNTLEALVGAYLVHRFAAGPACFDRTRDIFKFALLAALLATTLSATTGVASLSLGRYADWSRFGPIWLTWWLGDACGALIVTPLLVLWFRKPRIGLEQRRNAEALWLLSVLVAVGLVVFVAPGLRSYPLAYLCLPPLAWAAFRFGQREVATAVGVLTVIATGATDHGWGPFVMPVRNESLLVLQSFMATMALMTLPIAALVAENRRAVAQAEAASRAKDEFLAMLGHELRNPLQAIATSVILLRKARGDADTSERSLAIIDRQTAHLTRLVNDLLDVTRAITGKVRLECRAVDLEHTLKHCVEQLADSGHLGHHTLKLRTTSVWVHGDPVRLEQVFMNLLTNALRYTPPGGTIELSLLREGDGAIVAIQDNGMGIEADLLPCVFDPFVQGDRSLDRRQGGLGVGLTLVRRLVQLHGGQVHAHSNGPGTGSRFTVRLPSVAAPASHVSCADAQVAGKRWRVLIVEDNADARESLSSLLALEGHEVLEAADGEAGLELALELRPDAAFIDIGLPVMDGYELARRLRARGASLWLVALTGYGQPTDRQRSLEAGFDDHLVKPLGADDLARALRGNARQARDATS